MTYETLSMESFHRQNYSSAAKAESFEDPVDLSCKKVPSPGSPTSSESDKESTVSSLRGSSYLEHHDETNNNDSKSLNGYHQHHQHQRHHERQNERQNERKNEEKHIEKQSQTHHYHHHHESTNYSNSSNHERKSPYENHPYMMTPPSDTSSPKKTKFQPLFEHTSPAVGDGHPYPSYPILPMGLGMTVPVPTAINMQSILPSMITPKSLSHSQITAPASTQESVRTSTPVEDTKKTPRPFKAYPKDPLSISRPDMMFDNDQKQAYFDFRNRMLESVKRSNEGTNIKMRRISKSPMLPTSTLDDKDAAYWERRRKNNEAAKRSRDARRAKEDEIAIRAAFLEQEFVRLKYENSLLKEENTKLSKLVYGS